MSRYQDDLGGQRHSALPASYDGVKHRACPPAPKGCGAEPEAVCTFVDAAGRRLDRHAPCVARCCQGAEEVW